LIVEASATSWWLGGITAAVAVLAIRTRVHPLWWLAAGSIAGLLGGAYL